jgi:DNA-binding transcriptional MerR regulator
MQYYTTKQVAEKTGLTYDQIWFHAITGKVTPAIQVGRSRLFSAKNIRQIKSHFVGRDDMKELARQGATDG